MVATMICGYQVPLSAFALFEYFVLCKMFGKEYSSDNAGDGPPSWDSPEEDIVRGPPNDLVDSCEGEESKSYSIYKDATSGSDGEFSHSGNDDGKEEHKIWMVNVGLRGDSPFSGNKLVDMIMKLDKTVKYFPIAIKCFNQWICLREIKCDTEINVAIIAKGRVRCAIQISPVKKPDGDEWYRKEWGWDPLLVAGKKYPWGGFEIMKVRIF